MFTVYIYVLDTLADWELGYVTAELNSGRFFKKDAPEVSVKTVAISTEPVKTMGGLTIVPDCTIREIAVSEKSVLLLPGANTWDDPRHSVMMKKAGELLSAGALVCAICGATMALASAGLLDRRPHTSNGAGQNNGLSDYRSRLHDQRNCSKRKERTAVAWSKHMGRSEA